VKKILNDANVNNVPVLQEFLETLGVFQPFDGLQTEYLQTKYFKEKFRLLVR